MFFNNYYSYCDFSYFIFMLPAIIVTIWAQYKVNSTFRHFSNIRSSRRITGEQAARRVLVDNDIMDVEIMHINGELNDHYDPKSNIIRLSDPVYGSTSIAALGVAAHEAGHAVQEAKNYSPMKVRRALVPIVNIGSSLSVPLILLGMFFPTYYTLMVKIGIFLFSSSVAFSLVTLPVEFDASTRAIKALKAANILDEEEIKGAKKVLFAAAMTYVAAALTSVLSLIRLILIYGRRNEDDR